MFFISHADLYHIAYRYERLHIIDYEVVLRMHPFHLMKYTWRSGNRYTLTDGSEKKHEMVEL